MSFQSKDNLIFGRQLEAQSIVAQANLVAATSDLPSCISINNSTIADTLIVINIKEPVAKVFKAQVTNRATGANIALEALPAISGNQVTLQVDGTAQSNVCVELIYKIQE
jgi:hypothetical protein